MAHRNVRLFLSIFIIISVLVPPSLNSHTAQAASLPATQQALSQTPVVVDPNPGQASVNSIVVDQEGTPHIAYYDPNDGDPIYQGLMYATKYMDTWYREEVDANGGFMPSIALDSAGRVHIAYYDLTNSALRYATPLDPDGWNIQTIDTDGLVGASPSLVIDPGDQPHIAYLDMTNGTVKYAKYSGTAWEIQSVATIPAINTTISLALTQSGLPRFIYTQANGQLSLGLGYAEFNGTAWSVETIVTDSSVSSWSSLALDQNDNPHISYANSNGLKYLTKTDVWSSTESVDTSSTAGSYNRQALNSLGNPSIVYSDGSTVELAFKDGSVWRSETLLASGAYPFITYDTKDVAHISLVNTSSNLLSYINIPPFPDLTVTDVWQVGDTIHFQVHNTGLTDASAGAIASLLINDGKAANYTFPGTIPANTRVDASFTYTFNCTLGEQNEMRVDINPGNVFPEITRLNNTLAETWTCLGEQPIIETGPIATSIGQTSAIIQWETNVATDSVVEYGRRAGNFTKVSNSTQTTTHSITLKDLNPGATYAYKVTSKNLADQSVTSKVSFFETLPSGGSVPTGITRTITRDPGTAEIYTISANIPNASGAERVDFYYQLDGSTVREFIGSAYGGTSSNGGGTVQFQTKFSPGKTGLTREQLASASIITEVSILGGGSAEYFEDLKDTFQPLAPEIQITSPNPDYTFYVNQDTVPLGTTIPVSVYTSAFEWGCEWSGDSFTPDCDEVAKLVDKVQFVINPGARVKLIHPVSDYIVATDLNIGGLSVGNYNLLVYAISGDKQASVSIPFHIERGKAKPVVERTVYRVNNSFNVVLKISNAADADDVLIIDSVIDNIRGFQPVFDDAGDVKVRSSYSPDLRFNRVIIDIDQGSSETRTLDPGESYQASYHVIPILYEDYMIYEMGNTELAYVTADQTQFLITNLPAATAVDPSSATPISLANSVSKALKLDDYLLITHPGNLKSSFGTSGTEPNWNTLLRRMAQLAQLRQGALAYMDSQDAETLDLLLEPETPTWVDKLHPNFTEHARGYVLIVGEPGVMPSNSKYMDRDQLNSSTVNLTDNPFSHTGGSNGAPELVLGRIPGNNVPQLIKPIETSIKVILGELVNNRDHALGSVGTGDGISTFQSNANEHLQRLINNGWNAKLVNEEDEIFIQGPLDIPFDEGDLVVAGDLNGDGKEEFIIGDISTDEIWIVEYTSQGYNRLLWVESSTDLRPNTGFVMGNVDGDAMDELFIGDYDNVIYCANDNTIAPIYHDFDYIDELLLANMDADPALEIVIAQGGDVDIYNAEGGPLVRSFSLQVDVWDTLIAGHILDGFLPNEFVHFDYSEQRAFIYSGYGALLDDFPAVFDMQDSIIVADVDNSSPDDYPAEIWATDWRHGGIKVYQTYGDASRYAWLPQRLDDEEKLVLIQPGFESASVWLMRRSDEAFQIDRNYARHMQSYYAELTDGMDYIFYRGHGNSAGWESINVNTNSPLSFGYSAPIAMGLTCLSGDYGGNGNTFSEKMLLWGAGAFFGSTETSTRVNNNQASGWIANHAHYNEPIALTLLIYKNNKWGGIPWYGSYWSYWGHEYNFYGDAKFGYIGDTTLENFIENNYLQSSTATKSGEFFLPADTALHLEIPKYEVTQVDAYDYVDIPGGDIYAIDGQIRIPFYTVVQNYPAGVQVSDVKLEVRGGLETNSGLNLPLYVTEIDSSTEKPLVEETKTPASDSEYDWLPDPAQWYYWDVSQKADGSSQLFIYINPFYYSPSTTAVEFYSSYDFTITTFTTEQKIISLGTDQSVYHLGEQIQTTATILNESATKTDLIVNAYLRNMSGEDVAAAELHILESLAAGGNATFNATIPTTDLPPGNYEVILEVRSLDGSLIDVESSELTIGQVLTQLNSLTVVPEEFEIGDQVQIQLFLTNAGELLLSEAIATFNIFDNNGELIGTITEPVGDLDPAQSALVSFNWDTTGMNGDPYTVVASVVYNSKSTPTIELIFGDFNKEIYLPLLMR